jgi:hypothetical protein
MFWTVFFIILSIIGSILLLLFILAIIGGIIEGISNMINGIGNTFYKIGQTKTGQIIKKYIGIMILFVAFFIYLGLVCIWIIMTFPYLPGLWNVSPILAILPASFTLIILLVIGWAIWDTLYKKTKKAS